MRRPPEHHPDDFRLSWKRVSDGVAISSERIS
jgi:hypothetical protein